MLNFQYFSFLDLKLELLGSHLGVVGKSDILTLQKTLKPSKTKPEIFEDTKSFFNTSHQSFEIMF